MIAVERNIGQQLSYPNVLWLAPHRLSSPHVQYYTSRYLARYGADSAIRLRAVVVASCGVIRTELRIYVRGSYLPTPSSLSFH